MGENDDVTNRIYVSVRTRVIDSNGDKLHPCKIRLCRRMIRDKLYRGRTYEETIRLFSKKFNEAKTNSLCRIKTGRISI